MAWTSSVTPQGSCVKSDAAAARRVARNGLTGFRSEYVATGLKALSLLNLTFLAAIALGALAADQITLVASTCIALMVGMVMPFPLKSTHRKADQALATAPPNAAPEDILNHQSTFDLAVSPRTQNVMSRAQQPGEAWSDLASRISHELRTPLNAVIGFSDLMQRELHGPLGSPQYTEYSRHIGESGKALLKSAEDTLAMTSALARSEDATDHQPACMRELIASAVAFLQMEADRCDLVLHIGCEDGLAITGDRRTQRQVLLNMISDVIQSARCGSVITIEARHVGCTVRFDVQALAPRHFEPAEDSLDLCLARALLEIQGAHLIVRHMPAGTRRVSTVFQAAAQVDFFDCLS